MNIVEKTNYSKKELEEFRAIILKKIMEAKEELKEFKCLLANSNETKVTVGDGAVTSEKEQISTQANRTQKFIEQLEAALVRIENKTYGICRETGKLIPRGRLLAVPHTTLCIEAKKAA